MALDVVVPGGLFDVVIRKAEAETTDAATGDKANVLNMALARGFLLMWDYGERINQQSALIETDLTKLADMQAFLKEAMTWTPADFTSGTPEENQVAKAQLLMGLWAFNALNPEQLALMGNEVSLASIAGVLSSDWPPFELSATYAEIQADPTLMSISRELYRSSDGVVCYRLPNGPAVSVDWRDVHLAVPESVTFAATELSALRRNIELSIESHTQVAQNKQAFLQDLVANLQKWFTFTTSVLDKRKRDADGIVANFR